MPESFERTTRWVDPIVHDGMRLEVERWKQNFKDERMLRKKYEAELAKVHAEGRWHCPTCTCEFAQDDGRVEGVDTVSTPSEDGHNDGSGADG